MKWKCKSLFALLLMVTLFVPFLSGTTYAAKQFKDADGTIYFPAPDDDQAKQPPVILNPTNSVEIDVDKQQLIANGVDSTYVTVSFKDCNGNSIPYDRSLAVRVTSSVGAGLNGGYYDEKSNSNSPYGRTSIISATDGPDVTVKVTAPRSTNYRTDTITFEVLDRDAFGNTACLTKPVNVSLDYVPQAEVRLETLEVIERITGYEADGTPIIQKATPIRATIVAPGGQIVRNFNGRVYFHSTGGSRLSSESLAFWNGTATIDVFPLQTIELARDVIIAEVIPSDSRYPTELNGVLNQTHSIEVLHDTDLRIDQSCTAEIPEMAFVIDSSGSMKRNDPDRLRVAKTQELIARLNATRNIATDFNSSARFLKDGSSAVVKPYISMVREQGGTNIGAGLTEALGKMNSPGRKAAILLTDGKSSEKQIQNAVAIAKDKGIAIFTIGLGNEKNLNTKLLQQIATDTGGSYYHVTDSVDLGHVYQSIIKEITCGVKLPTCSAASQIFVSPSVRLSVSDVFMETDIHDNCGDITKVIVRFVSDRGNIDYELVHRGQNNYRFIRGKNEIENIQLYKEAQFIAYDWHGNQIGAARTVIILPK